MGLLHKVEGPRISRQLEHETGKIVSPMHWLHVLVVSKNYKNPDTLGCSVLQILDINKYLRYLSEIH